MQTAIDREFDFPIVVRHAIDQELNHVETRCGCGEIDFAGGFLSHVHLSS
jgi:hypothetical protein